MVDGYARTRCSGGFYLSSTGLGFLRIVSQLEHDPTDEVGGSGKLHKDVRDSGFLELSLDNGPLRSWHSRSFGCFRPPFSHVVEYRVVEGKGNLQNSLLYPRCNLDGRGCRHLGMAL